MRDEWLRQAKALADKLFADTSVPTDSTLESLEDLREHVEALIAACKTKFVS